MKFLLKWGPAIAGGFALNVLQKTLGLDYWPAMAMAIGGMVMYALIVIGDDAAEKLNCP